MIKRIFTLLTMLSVTNFLLCQNTTSGNGFKKEGLNIKANSFIVKKNERELTFIPLGQAGNAWSLMSSPRTSLWLDNSLNTIVFTHRMDNSGEYGNSRIAYDLSITGGAEGTWNSNIQVYEPLEQGDPFPLAAARYPQGGIYNPPNNTDPNNAYYAYYVPTLDYSSSWDGWGGNAYGVNKLSDINPPYPTQTNITSSNGIYRYIPGGFTIKENGELWIVDENYLNEDLIEGGEIRIAKGQFSNEINDFIYEDWLLDDQLDSCKEAYNTFPNIAFSPNGNNGYIIKSRDRDCDDLEYTYRHPVLYSTNDGGDTWNDVRQIELGGPEGIDGIKNYFDDSVLDSYYSHGWSRNTITYTSEYWYDIVVDANGNPHFIGCVMIVDEYGTVQYSFNPNSMCIFHFYSIDNGVSWQAYPIFDNDRFWAFQGTGPYDANVSASISTSTDGSILFFSYIDSGQETFNDFPDLYCRAYNLYSNEYTEIENVTENTPFAEKAFQTVQSRYVFTEIDGGTISCKVPFVFMEANPLDLSDPVQFWYIDGWTYEFIYTGQNDQVDSKELALINDMYPNPFVNLATIEYKLKQPEKVSLTIYDYLGKQVYQTAENQAQGSQELIWKAEGYVDGIYYYRLQVGDAVANGKMVKVR